MVRNRIKRRLRAAAQIVIPMRVKKRFDLVLIGRRGTLTRGFEDLTTDLLNCLQQVEAARNSNNADR